MKCLAKNTIGDGTGCDNMTAVIVQFKPKLLADFEANEEKPIDKEGEESNRKRVASPIPADNETLKKAKTDQEEDQQAVASLEAEAKTIDVALAEDR